MTFDCRSSKIRIWIHQRDLKNLQKVLWEGYGDRLKTETSADPKVRKFLDFVPHLMKLIQNIHQAVIRNDLEKLIELTSDPVPSIILSSKDLNGLTALHKAVGLGNRSIVEYIISKYPDSINIVDNEKRTPLFYSVLRRDNSNMYNFLLNAGSNESHLDIGVDGAEKCFQVLKNSTISPTTSTSSATQSNTAVSLLSDDEDSIENMQPSSAKRKLKSSNSWANVKKVILQKEADKRIELIDSQQKHEKEIHELQKKKLELEIELLKKEIDKKNCKTFV